MGVYESGSRIKQAVKDLNMVWEQTKAVWKDEKSRQFEQEFLLKLYQQVKKTQTAMDNINPFINRIRSELKE